jgi:hypothetical protein
VKSIGNPRVAMLTGEGVSGNVAGPEVLKNRIMQGGKLIELEDGAALLSQLDWGLKMKKADETKEDDKQPFERLKRIENAERDYLP